MTPDEEMLVKYAKIVKNYCEDGYKEHKCSGCTFERKGHCLLYLHSNTKITHDKENDDKYTAYVEPDDSEALMIHKLKLKLHEYCVDDKEDFSSICNNTNCIFNKGKECRLSGYPSAWEPTGEEKDE